MSFKKDVRDSLTEIKVELGKNTIVLNEHHVRSSNLEARMKPVEDHVIFISRFTKVVAGLAALGAASATIFHFFK